MSSRLDDNIRTLEYSVRVCEKLNCAISGFGLSNCLQVGLL